MKVVFKAFGTECSIQVGGSSPEKCAPLLRAGEQEALRIQNKYSRFLPTSELSRINREAALGDCSIDTETHALLSLSRACYEQSNGLFDITAAPLLELWKDAEIVPSEEKLAAVLSAIGMQNVELGDNSVAFRKRGIKLDLGGIGKEYAVDRVFCLIAEAGVGSVVVNFGGDLRVYSPEPLKIGVQSPISEGEVIAVISLKEGAIATSGDYARRKVISGEAYSHIVNPLSGMPCRYFASVSAVHQAAILAGGATTTAILLEEEGLNYLRHGEVPFFARLNNGDEIASTEFLASAEAG